MGRKLFRDRGVIAIAVVLALGAAVSLVMPGCLNDPDPTASASAALTSGTPEQAAVDWVQTSVVPEREAAVARETADAPFLPTGTQCPTVPAATDYVVGRSGIAYEVIIYGMIKSSVYPYTRWDSEGVGACKFDWSAYGGTCHIGGAGPHYVLSGGIPYGIMGDPPGEEHVDEIYPASYCSELKINCDTVGDVRYAVIMTGVPADAQWEICGDDCSITNGYADRIVGWSNRDRIFAGDGQDFVYGQGGSDCIFGDNGNDSLEGGGCVDADDEYLWGGYGNDSFTNNTGTCARYILGSYGIDNPVKGGPGNDTIYGGNDNDTLYGLEGTDYCNGEGHTTQDWCEPSPSCNTRVNCEVP
ncbi:MAG: hypothetical protein HY905_11370 [Deltaproteobacteria bacterium]|nr:hypothetical protein [Deltaproteobacteria bacterium]